MRRFSLMAAAILLGLTASCRSNLRVEVSMLHPDYLDRYRGNDSIEGLLARVRIAEDALDRGAFSEAAIRKVAKQSKELAEERVAASPDGEELLRGVADDDSFGSIVEDTTSAILHDARLELANAVDRARSARALSTADPDASFQLYNEAIPLFKKAQRTVEQLQERLQGEVELMLGASPEVSEADAGAIATGVSLDTVGALAGVLTPQRSVVAQVAQAGLGDPLLGHVVNAPNKHWKGLFNIASAEAFGSNSDVAIVMDDIAKFSVKGIRADSTSATAATFTTLGRVMSIASAATGLPVPGILEPEASGTAGTDSGTAASAPSGSAVQMAAERRRARAHLVRLMSAVLEEGSKLESDDEAVVQDVRTRLATRLKGIAD